MILSFVRTHTMCVLCIICAYCILFYHDLYRLVSYPFYRYISSYSFFILSGASSHSLPSSSKKRMTPPPLCGWYTIPPPTDLRFEGCFLSIGMWAGMVAIGTDIGTEELAHWWYRCRWLHRINQLWVHIAFDFCICYNADRQKDRISPYRTTKQNPRKCVRLSGVLFLFWSWQGLTP